MTKVLNDFKIMTEKLDVLIERYEFLVQENEILSKNYNLMFLKYQEKVKELELLESKYSQLKSNKTFEGSIEDKRETKKKINALIREIDKCIVQLND
ncbi:MAG: hypothetical protein ACPGRE_03145 [Flavobacteriaceae bacterium]